jgi:hypothetical protein
MLGGAAGMSIMSRRRHPKTTYLAEAMLRGMPLTPKEHQALKDLVQPPKKR